MLAIFLFFFFLIKRLGYIKFNGNNLDNLYIGIQLKESFGTPIWKLKIKKYLVVYHMTYGKFMCLIRELKPFIKSKSIIFLNPHYNLESYWVGVISICT